MQDATHFMVIASLTRDRFARRGRCWMAEVTDPASPLAGLTAYGWTARSARRALAEEVAHALVDDRFAALPEEVTVEVVAWDSVTYEVPIPAY